MNIKELSDRDILCLQYSILEELKNTKSLTNELPKQNDCWEYIKTRHYDKNGKIEKEKPYLYRLSWFENNCCTYKELGEIVGASHETIRKIAQRYKWKQIKAEAIKRGYVPKHNITANITKPIVKRDDPKYYQFRQSVLKRDKVCQCCGAKTDLVVHHLFSFNDYNHLGADPKNGIVLCKECHKRYHSQYGTKKRNNPVTLAQFLRDYGMNTQTKLPSTSTYELSDMFSIDDLLSK